jgi:predicted CXXCH cytochrome family protein
MDRRRLIWLVITLVVVAGSALVTYSLAVGSPERVQPGELSTAHDGIDCMRCHDDYQGITDDQCLDCHEDVLSMVWHDKAGGGQDCTDCHYEHVGKDYITDLTQVPAHPERDIELSDTHLFVQCNECHWSNVPEPECSACHQRFIGSTHLVGFSEDCDLCHVQLSWDVEYDHEDEVAECVDCHDDTQDHRYPGYLEYNSTCDACHEVDVWVIPVFDHERIDTESQSCQLCHPQSLDLTYGARSDDCSNCHLNTSWTPQRMDHQALEPPCQRCHEADLPAEHLETERIAPLDCDACHEAGVSWARRVDHSNQSQPCIQCHGDASELHDRIYADDCQWCHVADHRYILKPHPSQDADCTDCHAVEHEGGSVEYSVDARHATACGSCHVAGGDFNSPMVNHSLLGQDCYSCHQPTHDPIGGWEISCGVCHDTEYWLPVRIDHDPMGEDCLSCHVTVHPNGKERFSEDCTLCHNTEDWAVRTWDHSLVNESAIDCVNCHDDIHLGTLGLVCEDCHVQDTWETEVITP